MRLSDIIRPLFVFSVSCIVLLVLRGVSSRSVLPDSLFVMLLPVFAIGDIVLGVVSAVRRESRVEQLDPRVVLKEGTLRPVAEGSVTVGALDTVDFRERIETGAAKLGLVAPAIVENAERGEFVLDGRTRVSLWTWGEYVTVELSTSEADSSRQTIRVRSKPRVFSAVFDYGQNRSNVVSMMNCLLQQRGS